MKPTVYVETTVPSYLTAWPSRDVVRAGEQQLTRDWWARRSEYELRVSSLVLLECRAGDPDAAALRLAALDGVPVLAQAPEAEELAATLLREVPLPARAAADALHIAVAAVNGVSYLVTWNCTHIANASLRPQIEAACRRSGYEPPVICTPRELLGEESEPCATQTS
jgi:predicted nucleic acid-binding protein